MRGRFLTAFRLLRTDFGRAVFSWPFLCSAMGVTATMFMVIAGMLTDNHVSIWYLMDLSMQGSGIDCMMKCILPVFAFGLSYASEWEQKAQRFWLVRTGADAYAFSRVMVSFLSGFLTIFVGIGLFIVILLPFYPVYLPWSDFLYEMLVAEGRVLAGLLLYMTHHGLTGGLTAVCSMWFSTVIPNRFATAAAPLVIYYSLLRITERMRLPGYLSPFYWNSGVYYGETAAQTIAVKLVTTAVLCGIMGVYAKRNMERRMLCE